MTDKTETPQIENVDYTYSPQDDQRSVRISNAKIPPEGHSYDFQTDKVYFSDKGVYVFHGDKKVYLRTGNTLIFGHEHNLQMFNILPPDELSYRDQAREIRSEHHAEFVRWGDYHYEVFNALPRNNT